MNSRITLEEEMRVIREDITRMSLRVEEDLRKAIQAFKTQDIRMAEDVRSSDPVVNSLQVLINDHCIRLLATQQPVAKDLRWIITTLKFADEMERIGDHAVHLAKSVIKLEGEKFPATLAHLEAMAENGCAMIQGVLQAYLEMNGAKAKETAAMDDITDKNHKELVNDLIEHLQKNPVKAQQITKMIQTSGYLERLGDHVTNICEAVVYCIDGAHVELND